MARFTMSGSPVRFAWVAWVALAGSVASCGEAGTPSQAGVAGNAGAGQAVAGATTTGGSAAGAPSGGGGMASVAGTGGMAGLGGGPSEPVIPGGPDESIPADPGVQPFVHPLFTDHMVLQRDAHTPIWGWSAPGDEVTLKIAGETYLATADQYGRWLVRIGPFPADATTHQLEISGPQGVTFEDVKFGDVWLCSGQSNMEFSVNQSLNSAAEIAASANPDLRFFAVQRANLKAPRQTFEKTGSAWTVVGPATIPNFSAVCYFMVRELQKQLKVPMGMIGSSWGGTNIQSWMSAEKLATLEDFRKPLDALPALALDPNQPVVTSLYNGMIAPLLPYGLKGIAWYQGESNAGNGLQYSRLMPDMIDDWRTRFRMGKLPFFQVQLANFIANAGAPAGPIDVGSGWALLREAQLATQLADDKVGMAVILDVGDPNDIHPKDKQDVGLRLAASARHVAYAEDVVHSGPLFKAFTVQAGKVQLSFDQVGTGLMLGTKNGTNTNPVVENAGGVLAGFALAGADQQWRAADAVIDAGGQTITVSSNQVATPVAVRYGWSDNPSCNLYNREGLMASSFRTDLSYGLSVVDGSGGGVFDSGAAVVVTANVAPQGQHFVKWVGDVQYLSDANTSPATVTLPKAYVSIRATYSP